MSETILKFCAAGMMANSERHVVEVKLEAHEGTARLTATVSDVETGESDGWGDLLDQVPPEIATFADAGSSESVTIEGGRRISAYQVGIDRLVEFLRDAVMSIVGNGNPAAWGLEIITDPFNLLGFVEDEQMQQPSVGRKI